MLRSVKQFLAPPVFADEEKTRIAWTLNAVLVLVVIVVGLYLIANILFSSDTLSIILAAIMTLLPVGLWIAMRRGHVQQASILLSTALMIAVTLAVYSSGGIRAPITSAYLLGIAVAGLLVSTQAAIGMVALAAVALVVLSQAEINGQLIAYSPIGPLQVATYLGTFCIAAVLLSFSTRNAREALERADHRERDLDTSNRALEAIRASLEQRVIERTTQLQISAEVGRVAAAILDQDQLLHEITTLIADRFGFYYVAAFTLDSTGQFAVLRATAGEPGLTLKDHEHELAVGGQSMVGYATAQRNASIAPDVGNESLRSANTLLPDARSEIALPLIAGNRVLGALDVQSRQAAAFDDANTAVLQAMADQIAVALHNAMQFKQTELQARLQGDLNQFSRSLFAATGAEGIYRVLATALPGIVPHDYLSLTLALGTGGTLREYLLNADADPILTEGPVYSQQNSLSGRAFMTRQPAISGNLTQNTALDDVAQLERLGFQSTVSLPLNVGERILGTLNFASQNREAFSLENSAWLEQLTGQVAVALESQRLAEAQQRSLRDMESLTRQLTGQAWSDRLQQDAGQVDSIQYARSGIDTRLSARLPEIEAAIEQRAPIAWSENIPAMESSPYKASLAVPIMLRGEALGALQVGEMNETRAWTNDDITFMQAVADQVALALENQRLTDVAQSAAQRDRAIAETADKIHQPTNLDAILRVAVNELSRVTGISGVGVQLGFAPDRSNGQDNHAPDRTQENE